jgi:hypothetical protein
MIPTWPSGPRRAAAFLAVEYMTKTINNVTINDSGRFLKNDGVTEPR